MDPKLVEVKAGWAAVADWWAVIGKTKEEALEKFREAERRHQEIAGRVTDSPLAHPPGARELGGVGP